MARGAAPVAAWVLTRAGLLLLVLKVVTLPGPDVTTDVEFIYRGWYEVLRTGTFPVDDVSWQYPPGAALAVLSPALLPFLGYAPAFFALVCAADAVVLALLLRAGGGGTGAGAGAGRSRAGAWFWVAGVPLLGPTAYARYDLMVTAVAVAALLAAARRPAVAGALAGFGTMLKVWPVLLLLGAARGRTTRLTWGAAAGTAAAVALAAAAALPGAFGFLTAQRDRGTEVESLGALVFHVGRHLGWDGTVQLHYGSMEFLGPGVGLVSDLALGLSAAAMGWLVLWRLRAREFTATTACEAAFAGTLLFTTTSRVISPQYLIWLVGLAAVCLTLRAARMALPAGLVLAATGVTLAEFPVWFGEVVGSTGTGIALLALRNGLLVAATVVACVRLWRSTVPAPRRRARARGGSRGGGRGGGVPGPRERGAPAAPGSASASDELLTW
ncbi:glycosyltransferase 87 family protein [Streptomyces sp. MAR4 CNX-425]|uniref:glycosyltransferase 87 family protein n=1 Tax=Streptomyces sp. MAR4 CNX-425 TaxID=3406343 RepID=UPI003B5152A7